MIFTSYPYLIFLLVVVPVFHRLSGMKQTTFLLLCSYAFYAAWDPRFLIVLFTLTAAVYALGLRMGRCEDSRNRKRYLIAMLILGLGALGVFKYYGFFISNLQALLSPFGLRLDGLHLKVILPVGISFYTFQALSYGVDVYFRRIEPCTRFPEFMLYVGFFPTVLAGPIERASGLLKQLETPRAPLSRQDLEAAVTLITYGFFKKVVVGDPAGQIADHIFAAYEVYASPELLLGIVAYWVQIYFDFSGYSLIAMGSAKLFGIHLTRNFRQPYLSSTITDFWRSWHISLSSWIRDYLYIPLGGSRRGEARTIFNLMVSMGLCGLWHNASWTFVAWGLIHGCYLSFNRLLKRFGAPERSGGAIRTIGKVVVLNVLVMAAWVFFRAESFEAAAGILRGVICWTGSDLAERVLRIMASYAAVTFGLDLIERRYGELFLSRIAVPARYAVLLTGAGTILLFMFQTKKSPFVYFQF